MMRKKRPKAAVNLTVSATEGVPNIAVRFVNVE